MNNFRIINYKHFYKAMGDYYCGNSPLIEVNPSDIELKFYDVKPSEGYEIPVNKETGEKLPNCCETHKKVFKSAQDWFNDFPNCCDPHRNLLKATWFNKEDYKEIPLKLVNQLAYTTDHIARNIDKQDWYKDITDYIEYNINSFGQLPTGFGNPVGIQIYISQLKNWIDFQKDESLKHKFKQLNDFIDSQITPITPSSKETGNERDLNILIATYQKWLKIFPFGISYFAKLKQHFSSSLPFLAEMDIPRKETHSFRIKLTHQIFFPD